jgi:hypothetical protein
VAHLQGRSGCEAVVLVDESVEQVLSANIARATPDQLCGWCERSSEAEGTMGPAHAWGQRRHSSFNKPDSWQIELPANNLSHRFELPR